MSEFRRISKAEFRKWHDDNFYFIVRTLLPGGKIKYGNQWEALNPVRADKKSGSFLVCISGGRRGCWKDFASGDGGGDLISLMAYLRGKDHKSKEVRKEIYKELVQQHLS